jgi:hypothetical protein
MVRSEVETSIFFDFKRIAFQQAFSSTSYRALIPDSNSDQPVTASRYTIRIKGLDESTSNLSSPDACKARIAIYCTVYKCCVL